jgi:hypothetical protein
VHRLAGIVLLSALVGCGCGGKASPQPVGEQLRAALQRFVTAADSRADVSVCSGPPDNGPGGYVCLVQWRHGGGPPAFHVHVDGHGRWRTAEIPYVDGLGGDPIGWISGRGLRLR